MTKTYSLLSSCSLESQPQTHNLNVINAKREECGVNCGRRGGGEGKSVWVLGGTGDGYGGVLGGENIPVS